MHQVKTLGATDGRDAACDVIEQGLLTRNGDYSPLITLGSVSYDHLMKLELADSASIDDVLEVDVLLGCDLCWKLVTMRVQTGGSDLAAMSHRVLSSPADQQVTPVNVATHALRIDTYPVDQDLDDHLKQFWEPQSIEG